MYRKRLKVNCDTVLFFTDIQEVGRSAQSYAELSSRTVPLCSDVAMALIDMGKKVFIENVQL